MSTLPTDGAGPRTAPTVIGRRALIAVSLKLYFDVARTDAWCTEVASIVRTRPAVMNGATEIAVLPSLPALPAASHAFAGTTVRLGAQDLFHEDRGPFTGAVSGADLRAVGCTYVEVGHVERRTIFGEDDRTVALKTRAALRNGLTPILCIGELRKASTDFCVAQCVQQLESAIPDDLAAVVPLVVAYEPAWAIGAAEPATPEHVSAVTRAVRAWLVRERPAIEARIIYGGSAGVGLLTALGDAVDGLFLGRFAHDPSALSQILNETADLRWASPQVLHTPPAGAQQRAR